LTALKPLMSTIVTSDLSPERVASASTRRRRSRNSPRLGKLVTVSENESRSIRASLRRFSVTFRARQTPPVMTPDAARSGATSHSNQCSSPDLVRSGPL
jgi:hypothetical protein